jgi:hypothetical protein
MVDRFRNESHRTIAQCHLNSSRMSARKSLTASVIVGAVPRDDVDVLINLGLGVRQDHPVSFRTISIAVLHADPSSRSAIFRVTLADHNGIAGSIDDVRDSYRSIREENPGVATVVVGILVN